MKVSVIVAAYNIEDYIERCILSIMNQTLKDIEIIVVNDGSTDKTLSILKKLENKDNRIKIIDKNNEGVLEARKTGLNKSIGEYILFVDGDDWLEDNALEKLYNTAKTQNKDIVIYNAFWIYNDKKEQKYTFNKDINIDIIKNLFLNDIMPGIVFKFIKREYIVKNNIKFPNNISFAEDLVMSTQLFICKPNVTAINDSLYNYYQREGSISRTYDNKVLEIDKAISFIKQKLIEHKMYDVYRLEFENLVFTHLFFYRIIKNDNLKYNQKQVYKQWKNRKIKIHKNKYIKKYIDNEPLSSKIRISLYNINYNLGILYDYTRSSIKK